VDSIKELKQKGFLRDIDMKLVISSLEASELLLRELKTLYDAFGKD
jgi:hypothetical protein